MTDGPLPALLLARATLDRAAERRLDEAWLARVADDPATRVLVVDDGRVAVTGTPPRLVLVSPADVPRDAERYLLGLDDDGTAYLAAAAPLPQGAGEAVTLRQVGADLDDRDAGMLVHAVALEAWHRAHPRCSRCGAPTVVTTGGHVRRCPDDGSDHYPRTDPAVIMAVVDADDRVLLGRQAVWPQGRFSTLAGFVEPGESLERAVAREVLEEVGVRVGRTEYLGSQPWPFPASLMVGFLARAETTEVRVDDDEIAEARWFSREELAAACADGTVSLPPRLSIARRLVEHWFGGPLEVAESWR